jgi:hypothetical protein
MIGKGLTRKAAAVAISAFVCGGAALAAAATMPAPGASHHSVAFDDPTSGVDSSTEAPTSDDVTTDEPTTEAPTTEAPTTDEPTTEAPTTDVPTSVGETTTTLPCNHGSDVSAVAHSAPRGHDAPHGEHGKEVSDAAHHKCDHAGDGNDQGEDSNDQGGDTGGDQGDAHGGPDTGAQHANSHSNGHASGGGDQGGND